MVVPSQLCCRVAQQGDAELVLGWENSLFRALCAGLSFVAPLSSSAGQPDYRGGNLPLCLKEAEAEVVPVGCSPLQEAKAKSLGSQKHDGYKPWLQQVSAESFISIDPLHLL